MNKISIGLLDFGRRAHEINGLSRVEDVLNHAIKAEELGFSHFWLGEHHTEETGLPWCSPEILLPVLAGITETIRVGMAGILLLIHSPYRIALNFKLMANLFPNRIDLGLAKGVPANNTVVESLLGRKFEIPELMLTYKSRIKELMRYLKLEDELKLENIIIPPHKGDTPDVWYLGTAFNDSLNNSLEDGLHYCRSLFHGDNNILLAHEQRKLAEFREQYEIKHGKKPRVNIAFAGVCHKTEKMAKIALDKRYYAGGNGTDIIGTPEKFSEEVYKLSVLYDIEEFTFFNLAAMPEDIIVGDTLISEAFDLKKKLVKKALRQV